MLSGGGLFPWRLHGVMLKGRRPSVGSVPDQTVILLVADHEDDVLLVRKTFDKNEVRTPLRIVRNWEEAIHYLTGEGAYANRGTHPLPAVILLTLKKLWGRELVRWIGEQPGFTGIPVVAF